MTIEPPVWPRADIWQIDLSDLPDTLAQSDSCLSDEELERSTRFATRALTASFILRRAIRRQILAAYVGGSAEAIRFDEGPHGKPSVCGADIHFNASHCGDNALLVVSPRPMGIDIERVRPIRDLDSLAGTVCSPSQCSVLAALPDNERTDAFFSLWVKKESIIKLSGKGLSEDLRRLEIDSEGRFDGGVVRLVAAPEGYFAAVACAGCVVPDLRAMSLNLITNRAHG